MIVSLLWRSRVGRRLCRHLGHRRDDYGSVWFWSSGIRVCDRCGLWVANPIQNRNGDGTQ